MKSTSCDHQDLVSRDYSWSLEILLFFDSFWELVTNEKKITLHCFWKYKLHGLQLTLCQSNTACGSLYIWVWTCAVRLTKKISLSKTKWTHTWPWFGAAGQIKASDSALSKQLTGSWSLKLKGEICIKNMLIKETVSFPMIISWHHSCSTTARLVAVWTAGAHFNSTDGKKHQWNHLWQHKKKTNTKTESCNMRRSTWTCSYFWRTSLERRAELISTRGRRVHAVITGVLASCVYETRGKKNKEEGLDPAWEKRACSDRAE